MSRQSVPPSPVLCVRHLYYGLPVLATVPDSLTTDGYPVYCEECADFMRSKLNPARGGVVPIDPLDQPTIDKEA